MYGDPAQAPATHRFRFAGTGTEYFQVWIVNVLLTILTFGIYSAWAKVRNKQYFYGNTWLDDVSFEYTANPVSILKGRLLVVAFFVVYSIVAGILPPIEPVFAIAIVFLLPWALVRALAFNLRYSSHRNIRFRFTGRYGHALVVYVLGPIAAVLTLGLLWPFVVFARKRFVVEHARYGTSEFEFDARPGRFYVIYLIAAGAVLGFGAIAGFALAAAGVLGADLSTEGGAEAAGAAMGAFGGGLFVAFGAAMFAVGIYVQVATTNYQWQCTRIRDNRFDLQMRFLPMLWIQLSNLVLIILTLGLFIPFAKVRLARYRIESFSLEAAESLDAFAGAERERESALGEEFGDWMDLDLGL